MSRGRAVARGGILAAWLAVSLPAAAPLSRLAAQERPPSQPADSALEQQVDSTRLRTLKRLQRLGRPLGSDSILYLQDSIRQAEAREGRAQVGGGTRDSTVMSLIGMKGYTVTEYQGGVAEFDAKDRVLVLQSGGEQKARVTRDGMDVQADTSIAYDEATGVIRTVGASTATQPTGETVESQGLVYDIHTGLGSARGAKTSYQQSGANWYVTGDMPLAAQDSSYMSHARFTSCDLTVPHYHFETDEIKIVGGKVLIARPVRLYFEDVPVAWLPFIAQSLSRGRASGILTPVFSVNDIVRNSTGYRRRISNLGFYWAMSDYSDAVLALDWFSGNYTALTSQVTYRWNRQFLNGNIGYRQYWRADGSKERALDTRHSWDMDERTQLRMAARYVSSTDFLQQNSFNPAEVTQSINSEGGIQRRFDWGTMSASANRQEYLSDNRVAWTLPSVSLNLSTVTLFRAPLNRSRFWNNMTWSGRASFDRKTLSRQQPDTFDIGQADTETRSSGMSSTLSVGSLSFSQSLNVREDLTKGVPLAYFAVGDSGTTGDILTGDAARSINDQDLTWNVSVGYFQPLIGSTTLTPNVTLSGRAIRSDTLQAASGFVSEPSRVSFGASLKTDIYGFWPGFAGFSTIRHKLSPSFTYQWAPEKNPTPLQSQVFGSRVLQPQNALSITLNNTIEAKREESDSAQVADTATVDSIIAPVGSAAGISEEPRRMDRAQIVQLLGLRTSVIRYDFVEADSTGTFLGGFQTTTLSNQITSDFLQGLTISMDHELFVDSTESGRLVNRRFSPHLSSLNLGFSLNPRSQILQLLGLGGSGAQEEQQAEEEADTVGTQGFTSPTVDESSIIPNAGPRNPSRFNEGGFGGGSSWSANFSYSLRRPRRETSIPSQMLTASVRLRPTEKWNMSWRTSYDLELHQFNDHTVRLTRDLHRWEANFDFLKTATGNWQFRFEVSLTDNRDLKFDYQQRNLDAGGLVNRPVAR